jgi:hypothetical protein
MTNPIANFALVQGCRLFLCGAWMRNLKSNRMHGIKAGAYSESKYSNWTRFSPVDSEIDRVYNKYYEQLKDCITGPCFFEEKLHNNFIAPVTLKDLENEYSKIPKAMRAGLNGVFLLGGTSKIKNTSRTSFRYGTYWNNCIFLHPYPKSLMVKNYTKSPRPHILNDYKRVGAEVDVLNDGVSIKFTISALREFYLRDVFIHEMGHHVDRFFKKNHVKSEGFAEWFATEYGFRLRYFDTGR